MGRKMKSTKSGKFINPTDQARKEARKRELRKNKKQRLLVRTAVIKGKDPYQIITDMERLDKMEYDFHNPPPLNEKVLKDKRRKLKETWDRVIRLYSKDDKDRYLELKRMESDYEAKRNELIKQFDAIRSAQDVSIEDIPLPSLPVDSGAPIETVTHSILKSTKTKKQPPGCPSGLPPSLKEFEIDDDDDDDDDDEKAEEFISKKRIKFSDEVADSGKEKDNLTDFLKEIEQLSGDKDKKENNLNTINKEKDTEKSKELDAVSESSHDKEELAPSSVPSALLPPQPSMFPTLIPNPAPSVMLPPPNISAHSLPPMPGVRLNVPGFIPGRLPMHPPRLPMAPHRPPPLFQSAITPHPSSSSLSSNSSLLNYVRKPEDNRSKARHGSTIEAKPQLRNLSADSTKFMPLSLRVKRDEKQVVKRQTKTAVGYGMIHSGSELYSNPSIRSQSAMSSAGSSSASAKPKNNSKDVAYDQFMKEMQGFI